jgi:hypothetical protein
MLRFASPRQVARDGSTQHDSEGGFLLRDMPRSGMEVSH